MTGFKIRVVRENLILSISTDTKDASYSFSFEEAIRLRNRLTLTLVNELGEIEGGDHTRAQKFG